MVAFALLRRRLADDEISVRALPRGEPQGRELCGKRRITCRAKSRLGLSDATDDEASCFCEKRAVTTAEGLARRLSFHTFEQKKHPYL